MQSVGGTEEKKFSYVLRIRFVNKIPTTVGKKTHCNCKPRAQIRNIFQNMCCRITYAAGKVPRVLRRPRRATVVSRWLCLVPCIKGELDFHIFANKKYFAVGNVPQVSAHQSKKGRGYSKREQVDKKKGQPTIELKINMGQGI